MPTDKAMEARARRAAARIDHIATKSRGGLGIDNQGGFSIANERNHCVAGDRYEMTAEDVIEWCRQQA